MGFLDKLLIKDTAFITNLLPRKLRWKIYILFLYMISVAVFEISTIMGMTLVGFTIGSPQIIFDNFITQYIFSIFPDLGRLCSDPQWLIFCISIMVVCLDGIKNILTALLIRKQSMVSEDVAEYAGDVILLNYLNNTYMWHLSADSNETIIALNARYSLGGVLMQIFSVYTYAMIAIALVILLVSAMPSLILIVLVVTSLLCASVYYSMKRALDKSGRAAVESSSLETRVCNNAMRGIREVLIYRQQLVFRKKFLEAAKLGKNARAFLAMAPPIPTYVLEVYALSVVPLTTWILIRFYDADMALVTGVLALTILASWRAFPMLNRSLSSLVLVRSLMPSAMICARRLEKIKEEKLPVLPPPDPDFRIAGKVSLAHVNFRYPDAPREALEDICCEFNRGAQIGIVGLSGSGKSTMSAILAGLLDPESGSLLVDGKPLSLAELVAYRAKVGYVPQNPFLMAGSIAENVAFSQWGKPWDEEKVKKACAMAALDVVEHDERGINYPIGENGAGLSGGQAQRVSIARALYTDPEILIMDESTSSLDLQTESAIMETIHNLKGHVTIIIIAHRLSTVENCDWILWIQEGRLYKQGPAAEILPEYRASLG